MGDVNQLIFVRRHAGQFDGPYLEVGSRDYGTTQDLRSLFSDGDNYLGVDAVAGPGVDLVVDLTDHAERVDLRLDGKRFGTIFCLSVLEHCEQPFRMAENLTRLLKPHGKICISAPFAWQFHAYPADYWRFTHEGVKKLFPRLTFHSQDAVTSTSLENEFAPPTADMGKISLGTKTYWRRKRLLRVVSVWVLRLLSLIGILRWLSCYRHVLAPTNILMIGTLSDTECPHQNGTPEERVNAGSASADS